MTYLARTYMRSSKCSCSSASKIILLCGKQTKECVRRLCGLAIEEDELQTSQSIQLQKLVPEKRSRKKKDDYIMLKPSELQHIQHIVGISISPYNLGWVRVDRKKNEQLEHYGSSLEYKKGEIIMENEIYEIAKNVKDSIPSSDLYILERHKFLRKFPKESTITVQLISMLTALFNSNERDTLNLKAQRVFFQNPSVIDNLYDLRLKDERVSAVQALDRMMHGAATDVPSVQEATSSVVIKIKNVPMIVSSSFLKKVRQQSTVGMDACALALFLAASFIELQEYE